jgi:phosphatidylinositol alpha-1,6-mannosyltransferase
VTRTLVVTNDFPPRAGGIQSYVHALASRQPVGSMVVYAPGWPGAEAFDAVQPFPVVRHPGSLMLPVPTVARRAGALARAEGCDTVWFGAAAPLALLTPSLRRAGVSRVVASTHGHEVGWARIPTARAALRRLGREVDLLTYLGEYTHERIAAAVGPGVPMVHLPCGVDTSVFRPGAGGAGPELRARLGLAGRPVVVCVSRLVRRKGQDVLIRTLPRVRARVPGAALLVVGGGPDRSRLERLARDAGVERDVVFTGSLPSAQLPAAYAAGDVFAMPCRSRLAGLEVEGLGIVFLEASASGLPVVAGRSGGAPDAVLDGVTGLLVDGERDHEVAEAVAGLLADPGRGTAMGHAGRRWIERDWRWEDMAARLGALLAGRPVAPRPAGQSRAPE